MVFHGDAAQVERIVAAPHAREPATVREAELVAGVGDGIADVGELGDGATYRVGHAAHPLVQLVFEILAGAAELRREIRGVDGLEDAVRAGVRMDLHAGAAQGADLVPAHHELVGEVPLDVRVPGSAGRGGQLFDETFQV